MREIILPYFQLGTAGSVIADLTVGHIHFGAAGNHARVARILNYRIINQCFIAKILFHTLHLHTHIRIGNNGIIDHIVLCAFINPNAAPLGIVGVVPLFSAVAAEKHWCIGRAVHLDIAVAINPQARACVEIDLCPWVDDERAQRIDCRPAVNDVGFIVGPVCHLVLCSHHLIGQRTRQSLVGHNKMGILAISQQVHILLTPIDQENHRIGNQERRILIARVHIDLHMHKKAVVCGHYHFRKRGAGLAIHIDAEIGGGTTSQQDVRGNVSRSVIIDHKILRHRTYRGKNRIKSDTR